jgi:ribosomal protein S3
MFRKISFYKFKTFFRYLRYVFRYFICTAFQDLRLKGIKFQLKGKISVSGNARTRTIRQSIGQVSHSTFNNKVTYDLNLVKTFTGVQGLKI